MSSVYSHSTLPEGHIRLLRLSPHRDKDAPIECELLDYPLLNTDGSCGLYEALSYAWGSSEKPQSITIGEYNVPVTASLHSALRSLRDCFLERYLWADAICIDQGNTKEVNKQVQMMALIYARAARVLVWLGDSTEHSSQAIEHIRVAGEHIQISNETIDMTSAIPAVAALLKRSWFDRVWVLQEVAAARHVVIMCGSARIEGKTFCTGLDNLEEAYEDRRSLISPLKYLIGGAAFRHKDIQGQVEGFTLGLHPLGELIDTFHTRHATNPLDRVYALLGIRSVNPGESGLKPNYNLSWRELLRRLVKAVLSDHVHVTTWEKHYIAVIQSSGYVLGHVCTVLSCGRDRELICVRTPKHGTDQYEAALCMESTAPSVLAGDIVCILEGAPKPMIIRLCESHLIIVRISVDLMEEDTVRCQRLIENSDVFSLLSRRFLLIWDWERTTTSTHGQSDYKDILKVEEPFHKSQLALILWSSGDYKRAVEIYQKLWTVSKGKGGWGHPEAVTYMRYLASMHRDSQQFELADKFQTMVRLISQHAECTEMEQTGIYAAELFDQDVMMLLLHCWKHKTQFPDTVVEAAARNENHGTEMMRLLRNRRTEIRTTWEVILAATKNIQQGRELIQLLLAIDGDQINFTAEMILAVTNARHGEFLLIQLLDRSINQNPVTEAFFTVVAGSQAAGRSLLQGPSDQSGDSTIFIQEVVLTALENPWARAFVEHLFNRERRLDFQVTQAILCAMVCHVHGLDMLYRLFKEGYIFQLSRKVINRACVMVIGKARDLGSVKEEDLSKSMSDEERQHESEMAALLIKAGAEKRHGKICIRRLPVDAKNATNSRGVAPHDSIRMRLTELEVECYRSGLVLLLLDRLMPTDPSDDMTRSHVRVATGGLKAFLRGKWSTIQRSRESLDHVLESIEQLLYPHR
ncbi:hypothetical protein PFICI_02367 [Pestalotiopsis fici W106-1]|uniref:Heterokaryon incompatibility domain-containing protein n=1 Tax=Pestalotiopsis fici (strain W106-1 / CGMCC3.15140) TaxID=1229662 RepID=W3XG01_PESFW|nr:uncharacterized protein PFICI_02367 [Pestalotiopsis fici W106-1]ETS84342.1 hypothetical protein PFICI_02367 [Pestalotiopsis fici W106-1]